MIERIVRIVGIAVLLVSAVFCISFFISDGSGLETELSKIGDISGEAKIAAVDEMASGWTASILYLGYVLFCLCAVAAIGFAIYKFIANAIDNPRSAIKPLIALCAAGIVFLAAYLLASPEAPEFINASKFNVSETVYKWVDASIYGMYICLGLTIIALLVNELASWVMSWRK